MEKKKCEICGQMKPQNEFSKSYKRRCKACVAEAARNDRKRFKELEREATEALINRNPITPVMEAPTTYLPNPRYIIATHALQGVLASDVIMSHLFAKPAGGLYERIAAETIHITDALMEKLKTEES